MKTLKMVHIKKNLEKKNVININAKKFPSKRKSV